MSATRQSDKLDHLAITVASGTAASIPLDVTPPAPAELALWAKWKTGAAVFESASLSFDTDIDVNLDNVQLIGWSGGDSVWRSLGFVEPGDFIRVLAALGAERVVGTIGVFEAIRISAGFSTAAAVLAKLTPHENRG